MDFILGGDGLGAREPCGGLEVKSTGFADGRHGVEGEGYQGPGIHRAQRVWHKVGIEQVFVTQMKKEKTNCVMWSLNQNIQTSFFCFVFF